MTMIDRESASQLLKVLRTDDERQMINGHAALEMLARVMARKFEGPDYRGPTLSTGKSNLEKLERFFDLVIQVAPLPPLPYEAKEIATLARFSAAEYLRKIEGAKIGDLCIDDDEELEDARKFWRSIQADYQKMVQLAEANQLVDLFKFYERLDTADRENFGWGAATWNEGRWSVTRQKYR